MRIRLLVLVVVLLTGCATPVPTPETQITTTPEEASINIDGQDLGTSPVSFLLDFTTNDEYALVAKKEGYFTESKTITSASVTGDPPTLHIQLQASPMWQATTVSPATNEWMSLIVNPEIGDAEIWQRMVDATTKRFPELEEFDYNSGYIKSVLKGKRFDTPRGEFRLRSRFIAAVASEDPLTYKIKLISEWTDKGIQWYPYNRVFVEDSLLIKELIDRFGVR
ncbi:MAG: PEGA domain-containing protein [Arenicellales bacterium]|nr:PEGA domain-containing protein [Arenicellales bacterium]